MQRANPSDQVTTVRKQLWKFIWLGFKGAVCDPGVLAYFLLLFPVRAAFVVDQSIGNIIE